MQEPFLYGDGVVSVTHHRVADTGEMLPWDHPKICDQTRAAIGGRYRDSLDASRPRAFVHSGMTSGLSLGNFAIVATSTLRCWATSAGGVRANQSDREISAK